MEEKKKSGSVHTQIWVKGELWNAVRLLARTAGTEPSRLVMTAALGHNGELPCITKTKKGGVGRSLCVNVDDWEVVKGKAAAIDLSVSEYIRRIMLCIVVEALERGVIKIECVGAASE